MANRISIDCEYQVCCFSPLGTGTGGSVFLGNKMYRPGLKVAIKQIPGKLDGSVSQALKRYEMEVRTLAYCRGAKYILQFVDVFWEFGGDIWLVTELAPHGDLEVYTFLSATPGRKQLHPKVLPTLLFQLLTALKFLHARHMVHRDVKPANVLIFPPFKLGDFGFCTPPSASRRMLTDGIGTPFYTAPEVYDECYDERADIWSLAITVLSLLHDPFPGWEKVTSTDQFVDKLRQAKGPWQRLEVDKAPPELQEIARMLARMLQFDCDKRPSAAELLKDPYLRSPLPDEEVQQYIEQPEDN